MGSNSGTLTRATGFRERSAECHTGSLKHMMSQPEKVMNSNCWCLYLVVYLLTVN